MCLADAQLVIAREYGFPSWPKMKQAFETPLTLFDAIERLHRKLHADGKGQFAPLLTEESVENAILTSIATYRGLVSESGKVRNPDYFEERMVSLLTSIVETGVWPPFAILDAAISKVI